MQLLSPKLKCFGVKCSPSSQKSSLLGLKYSTCATKWEHFGVKFDISAQKWSILGRNAACQPENRAFWGEAWCVTLKKSVYR